MSCFISPLPNDFSKYSSMSNQIVAICSELKDTLEPHLSGTRRALDSSFQNSKSPPPCLAFPPIPDISTDLVSLNIPISSINAIVRLFDTHCLTLRTKVQIILQHVHSDMSKHSCSRVQTAPVKKLQSYLIHLYARVVSHWRNDLVGLVKQRQSHSSYSPDRSDGRPKPPKPHFNQQFVPWLEQYFEYNAYPSSTERFLMADRSSMTERQIEVWFQNHRNRARKDGKQMRRMRSTDQLPRHLDLRKLSHYSPAVSERHIDVASQSQRDLSSDDEEVNNVPGQRPQSITTGIQGAHNRTPSDMFIRPYHRPSCNPLDSATHSWSCDPPTWRRTPLLSTFKVKREASLSVDELALLFSKLNVRDSMAPQAFKPDQSAATRAITVICPTAPHPAFVRNGSPISLCLLTKTLSNSYSRSSPVAVRSPARPEPLCSPPLTAPVNRKARKFARLPKRIPLPEPVTASSQNINANGDIQANSSYLSSSESLLTRRRCSSSSCSPTSSLPATPDVGNVTLPGSVTSCSPLDVRLSNSGSPELEHYFPSSTTNVRPSALTDGAEFGSPYLPYRHEKPFTPLSISLLS